MAEQSYCSSSGLITCLNTLTSTMRGLHEIQQHFFEQHRNETIDMDRYVQNPFSMPTNRHDCIADQPLCAPNNPPAFSDVFFRNTVVPPITKKDCRTATAQAFDFLLIYPKLRGDPGVRFDFTDKFYVSDNLHTLALAQAHSAHDKVMQSSSEGRYTTIKRKWCEEPGGAEHASLYVPKESAALIAGLRAYVCEVVEFFRNRLPKHSVMFKPILLPGSATQLEFLEQLLHGAPPFLQTIISRAFGSLRCITGGHTSFPYGEFMLIVFDVLNLTKMAEEKRGRLATEAMSGFDGEVQQSVNTSEQVLSTVDIATLWRGPTTDVGTPERPSHDDAWELFSTTVQHAALAPTRNTNDEDGDSNSSICSV